MNACRLILDEQPGSGPWNMAVDEALLQSAVDGNDVTVRIYRWSEATLSLGYFQPGIAANDDPKFAKLPAVRRLSGGGAILHHHEITYSCAVPADHPASQVPTGIYVQAHTAIIKVLNGLGIAAALRGASHGSSADAFLCFSRGDPHDLLLCGHKIVGSAQRRRRGAVLQHGSLILRRSEYAPEHPGVLDLTDRLKVDDRLPAVIGSSIAELLSDRVDEGPLTASERQLAIALMVEKYSRLEWRLRTPAHS
ncbi:MAG: lipoate--protein ligase family protein [Planctomycetota bacterium]|nr:MAG: lipoate--protein ligase family protein [Planctomycetota bacterium]REJ89496.1 MAG: lipoate--protein ligase family protein [Planctomycetota bacterium]REK28934.1 MAG: lipoate--protein ligase family protein [Planctomycetota bacterium]REK39632.1 MAG: lipoate--protein ligase family protein [Planctomycetota bacterium]